jgi:alkanesulfonate monooxygenase SsuD/methylene tetrahydromethanopterin reductase-like flavin-dependent oxidoreductase (luciferase family)
VTVFGIGLPQDAGEYRHDGDLLRRFVASAETAGFDSLWVAESSKPEVLDPLGVLHQAAALSRSPRLGAAVLLTSFRAPLRLAREIATLDRLSGGRAILGVGLGNGRDPYAQYGLSVTHRGEHFERGIRALRSLLGEERTTSHEPWWRYDDLPRPLTPVQQPLPLWFGARSPAAIDRAVRLGDGWIAAGSARAADFTAALESVRRSLSDAGRPPETFTIAKRVYLHVAETADDDSDTRDRLRRWFGHHYGNPALADDVVVTGSAAACAEHLHLLIQRGVDTLILHPVLEPMRQLEALATGVLSLVGQTAAGARSTT